jgi:hypothetical protein
MFIKKEDFSYLEKLCHYLDEEGQKRFLMHLTKSLAAKTGEDILKTIKVVGDGIFDRQGVDSKEWVSRTMIKKAYKATIGNQ